jgi:hypothetical protein
MEIEMSQKGSFQELLKTDEKLAMFKDLLGQYLQDEFFPMLEQGPRSVEFMLFQDPDSGIERPMVEIFLPRRDVIQRTSLQHVFTKGFKEFLARKAKDAEDFIELRLQQRHFMIIFTIE